MKANISTKCSDDCDCTKPVFKQGPYSLRSQTWLSGCPNRSKCVECVPHEGCDNSRLSQKKQLSLEADLEVKLCWGFDVYTRYNVYSILGLKENIDEKIVFIECLLKVSNFVGFEGWNLRKSCEKMREMLKDKEMRTKLGLIPEYWTYCKMVEDLLLYKQGREGFRMFSKGVGVVCTRTSGIRVNELVVEYLGEVYSASQWFEKQDAIKMFQTNLK